jgi:hypothetical protein
MLPYWLAQRCKLRCTKAIPHVALATGLIERESWPVVGLNAFKHGPFASVCVDSEHARRMSILGTMGPRQFGGLLARDPGHRDGPANFVARYSWSCATGQHEHYGKRKQ